MERSRCRGGNCHIRDHKAVFPDISRALHFWNSLNSVWSVHSTFCVKLLRQKFKWNLLLTASNYYRQVGTVSWTCRVRSDMVGGLEWAYNFPSSLHFCHSYWHFQFHCLHVQLLCVIQYDRLAIKLGADMEECGNSVISHEWYLMLKVIVDVWFPASRLSLLLDDQTSWCSVSSTL